MPLPAAAVGQIWPPATGASFRRGLLDSTQIDSVAVGVSSPEPDCANSEARAPAVTRAADGPSSALARLLAEQQHDLAGQGLALLPKRSSIPPPPPRAVQTTRVVGGWATGGGALAKHQFKLNALSAGQGATPRTTNPSPRQIQAPLLSARTASRKNTPRQSDTPRMDGVGIADQVMDELGLESPRYTQAGFIAADWAKAELRKAADPVERVEAERKCVKRGGVVQRPEDEIDAETNRRTDEAYERACRLKGPPRTQIQEAFAAGKRLAGGEGGFGEVRQCVIDERQVAIKRCRGPRSGQQREAALLHTCQHPNVLKLYGLCTASDGLLLVTDLVKGGCLERVLLRPLHRSSHLRCLQLGRRLTCVADAATGIAHMHRQGVVHGDVKPANILVGDPTVIADFGLSCFTGAQKDAPEMGFSEGYRAPEVEATARMTAAGDVYALGMCLLQTLVGGSVTDVPHSALRRMAKTLVQATDEELNGEALQQGWTSGESAGILLWARLCTQQSPRGRPGMAEVAAGLRSIRSAS